ncbi:hypothetical protein CDG60_01970 [Acinetobacter chinensis]|uniref:Uncharacterized protein n=1 Tax=Acinetobacter chinensis TaxID=2004650 RepID=A0A3B7LU59_9GAMM|nr:hypothetical protein [Acinetobacter chinensis]AXY55474.1 hypothetical protein CDG60_01970 [Acinetobacter chinensis]
MDILNRLSTQISALATGEQWIVSAQDLMISRTDFQSLSVYLSRESQSGSFSVSSTEQRANPTLTVIKH